MVEHECVDFAHRVAEVVVDEEYHIGEERDGESDHMAGRGALLTEMQYIDDERLRLEPRPKAV